MRIDSDAFVLPEAALLFVPRFVFVVRRAVRRRGRALLRS
jgi:hypothetical protein